MANPGESFKEVPRIQRFADRPGLESVLADMVGREGRDEAIVKACPEFGHIQAHLDAATGLHYSTVSKEYPPRRIKIRDLTLDFAGLGSFILGTVTAWGVVQGLIKMQFTPDLWTGLATALAGVGISLAMGLLGTWRVLGKKAAPFLRNE